MPTRTTLRIVLVSLVTSLVTAACGQSIPPPERHSNALASIQERLIRASVADDDLAVDVTIQRRASGTIRGLLEITLTNVATGEVVTLDRQSTAVLQRTDTGTHRVVFSGAAAGLERAATGPMVLAWQFVPEDGVDNLYGRKSLYAALGNLDVQLRGPVELPAVGSSPLRVLVRDPASAAPIAGARVVAALVTTPEGADPIEHPLFEGSTDARGELLSSIALPEGVDAGSLRVSVAHGDVQVWTSRTVQRRGDDQLYLGSDKTIYQPGQDVNLRLLALAGPDRLPVADTEAVFEARDGRGNKVWRHTTRTDSFGVAAAIMPTDTRVNEGEWLLSAQVAGRQTQLRVPVEAYTLPRMRVHVASESTFALPGDTVRGRVAVSYLFGEPVRGASVTIDARTASGVSVGTLYASTDAQGMASYELVVPEAIRTAALEESGDTLLIHAAVTDTAGQTQPGEGAVPLAAAALRINAIADGEPRAGEEGLVYVVVTDAIGRPLVADVEVGGAVDAALTTNASGVGELRFTPATESVNLVVSVTDGAGRTHTRELAFGGSGDARLRISTDRAVYRPGEIARLRIRAGAIDRAWLDVYRGATGVLSTSVELVDGSAEIELPITEELGGLLVVDAYALDGEGGTLRAARPLLVERDDRLELVLGADRGSYGPGESAEIEVRVTDASGAPRVASVGLTVVDEAVFALGGEPRTTIQSSFGLDERVLPSSLSVAGRGPSDLLNTADPTDREQLARLLFASAAGTGGPNFAYGSLAEELPRVVSSLSQKLTHDGQQYLTRIQPLVDRGALTEETVPGYVANARIIDPFGRAYRLRVEGTRSWEMRLVVESDGPDEEPDTADDLEARLGMEWIFYGSMGFWGDEDFAGGGPRAGAPAAGRELDANADGTDGSSGGGAQARVRRDFRETAYVNPMLITDASGRARVTVPLAHSITTWRVSADGSSADGRVGASRAHLRTFQPFFVDFSLPTALTSGDELDVPAVVYNYTAEPQRVSVSMAAGDWFELLGPSVQAVDLGPSEVRAARFRIRVTRAGSHELSLTGSAGTLSDALVRAVSVTPAGQPEDETFSGRVESTSAPAHRVSLPSDTVEGGASLELVLTPGFAAEAVQGVEALLSEPNGCFEQTTSTAWPNTLVAQYLEATGELAPERREEVIALITRGYQRLLTFESPTGGFNWWGDRDPGNRILSAIMLWHLKDMEGLIETDPAVRTRTLEWLIAQQQADGSWESGDALHSGNEVLGTTRERTTAFITWALAHTGWADPAVSRASGWLRANVPPATDLYANALVANALGLADPRGATTREVFARLDSMRVDLDGEGGILWPTEAPSWTGAAGDAAALETTGLVAYGMIRAGAHADAAEGAIRFIIANKDSVGTWYNTQATMNALRALSVALTGGGGDADGTLVVTVDGTEAARVVVNAENRDLHRRFDLSRFATVGAHDVRLAFSGSGQVSYRLTRRAYRPVLPASEGPLSLSVTHDRTSALVGSAVSVVARAHNGESGGSRDQVIVRVGRAPGLTPSIDDLDGIVRAGLASRYEVRTDDVTFYLMNLVAGESRELRYRLVPGLPIDATAPSSRIYAYYEPTLQQVLAPVRFTISAPAP